MNQRTIRGWIGGALCSAFTLSAIASLGSAQAPTLHVSVTSNVVLGGETIDDVSLLRVSSSGVATPFFVPGNWLATAGFVPSDVDGFGRRPSMPAGSASSFAFSLLSNEGGFLDGDVLSFAPGGGLEVVVSETEILAALGVPSDNIDLDALDFDQQGCLFFSLQSTLNGTILGTIEDGDIVCYEPSTGKVWIEWTEGDIQAQFTAATGLTSAISDVQGLDFVNGQFWVVTQSPSSHDGAVLELGNNPVVLVEETDMGLGGAELNALSLAEDSEDLATIRFDREQAQAGETVTMILRGLPNTLYVGLWSGGTGWVNFASRPGFGAWYLDPADPWLGMILGTPLAPAAWTDANGDYRTNWGLPTAPVSGLGFGGESGW
ncbi:MAG TPA: hypothetical protein ENJ09_08285, partial [Planctomycetes bacterium]|nr:hypothetical protein [Planctomycetota bacterium]